MQNGSCRLNACNYYVEFLPFNRIFNMTVDYELKLV